MYGYRNKVRPEASKRMPAGERGKEVAGDRRVSPATLYRLKHQR